MSIIFHRTAPACTEIYTLSLHDALPIWKSPTDKNGRGVPEPFEALLPYRWGFGVSAGNPLEEDLRETVEFLSSLTRLGIALVNVSAGCPYYNPHVHRPALFPPSDAYRPPEDSLVAVPWRIVVT